MSDPASDTRLVLIDDHADRLLAELPSQFRRGLHIQALAEALGRGVQIAEEASFDLLVGRTLQSATGAQLDQWGAVVGEARFTLPDSSYRQFIAARLLANRCRGTADEVIAIWSLITSPHSGVRLNPLPPAGCLLYTVRSRFLDEPTRNRVRRLMASVRPAGVTMVLVEALTGSLDLPGSLVGPGSLARLI